MIKKALLCLIYFGGLSSFYLLPKNVQAESTQSKVNGTLVAPNSLSSNKEDKNKLGELPKAGEKASFYLVIVGKVFLIMGGVIWYSRKIRMNILKKWKYLFVGTCSALFILMSSTVFADSTSSIVTGEIVSGDFSITKPNNLNFSVTLNGQTQKHHLKPIQTRVTDYRGIEEGWQITVKSDNFEKYAQNYQLFINDQAISKSENIVYKTDEKSLLREVNFPVKVEISAKAQAGSYGANLEWNLQPNIKKYIKE